METSSSGTQTASENEAGNVVALKPGAGSDKSGTGRPEGGKPKVGKSAKIEGNARASTEQAAFGSVDVEVFSRNLARAIEQGGKALAAYMKPREEGKVEDAFAADIADIVKTVGKVLEYWLADPERTLQLQQNIGRSYLDLWASAMHRLSGDEFTPVVAADPKDKRFADPEWSQNQFYDFLKQLYLLTVQWSERLVKDAEGIDEHTRRKAEFYIKQFANAIAPSNFVLTNPELMRETLTSNAENLANGLEMLSEDIAAGRGNLRIRQTDPTNFAVGRNLALTPGKVIYQNELMQLIQYEATTDEVFKVPLLIVPPWINKFYILDLQPQNSVVRYLVEQGHRTFVISWRNPDESLKDKTWDDYIGDGTIKGIEVVQETTGARQINALGFCVGGTMLGTALAVLAARGEKPLASATFLTSFLDFSDTGVLDVFIDEAFVKFREMQLGAGGVLKGQELASTFSFLRPYDLVWNYVVGNYLKGETPPPFDLLYWNSDSTNLPGPMYAWYLRNTYFENNLVKPGKCTVCGEKVDLRQVDLPVYIYGSREDHIVPITGAYASTRHLPGKKRFVMGASGHIAGVINPPANKKRSYWTGDKLPKTFEEWFKGAKEQPGSWWPDWAGWLKGYAGKQIPAPKSYGKGKYKPIEPAPGRYVKARA